MIPESCTVERKLVTVHWAPCLKITKRWLSSGHPCHCMDWHALPGGEQELAQAHHWAHNWPSGAVHPYTKEQRHHD